MRRCDARKWRALRGLIAACWVLLLSPAIGAADPAEFDFQALKLLVERERIDSVDSLLAALPVELRSHYVLIFTSRSLQQATFRDPRAVLYGSDAHLILSFNGNPAERGYEMIETAEYDAREARFHFREIQFAKAATGTAAATFSAADPARCRGCHGTPPRPLWDTSPLWPGVYGERYRSNPTGAERAGLKQFLDQQPTHPRYRTLVAAERFAYRNTFTPGSEYSGDQPEPPNAELSELLGRMNMQMIARQLREQANFAVYQYALLGAAEGDCGEILEFLPAPLRAGARIALQRLQESTEAAGAAQDASKRARALPGSSGGRLLGASDSRASTLSAVRWLAEDALDIRSREWTLALEKGTYDFTTPRGGNAALAGALRARVEYADARLGELEPEREYSSDDRYCVYLRERSLAVLASAPENVSMRPVATQGSTDQAVETPELALQHCADCHAGGMAPQLPFDRPPLLRVLLHQGDYPHGDLLGEIEFRLSREAGGARMPPDANWPQATLEALSRYVIGLTPPPASP